MKLRRAPWVGLLVAALACIAAPVRGEVEDEPPAWQEAAVELPAFPSETGLQAFYVSATTPHKFFIDPATLSVGQDRVVRYVMVVRTAGGATNVSYEGMRCESRQYKIYATGRRDGTWIPSPRSEWRPIENKSTNRQHAALSRDFFCPVGNAIFTADEGRQALRLGKHPTAN